MECTDALVVGAASASPPALQVEATEGAMTAQQPSLRRGAAIPAPVGLRAERFRHGGGDYVLFSVPLSGSGVPSGLTVAEQDVTRRILAGQTNGSIALARATSVRTVANQVAAVFRKLGVASRSELAAQLAGIHA